jgi:hypothetical protein
MGFLARMRLLRAIIILGAGYLISLKNKIFRIKALTYFGLGMRAQRILKSFPALIFWHKR